LTVSHDPRLAIEILFWLSELIVLLVVLAPVTRFITHGWDARRQDFANRLANKTIDPYLDRFWAKTIQTRKWQGKSKDEQFSSIYSVMAGRRLYVVPTLLLTVTIFIFGGLVIMTGLRVSYEIYISTYQHYKTAEGAVFGSAIPHIPLTDLDKGFWPFPPVALDIPTLASVSGAYLYVAQVVIRGYKARTLLSSDLLWATFRLVIAIPLGMAVSLASVTALGPLVAFGLGAFPIAEINKLLRRLTSKALNDAEKADTDDLLQVVGVTPDISAKLNEEEVYSPQQLVGNDPVSLAVRCGLPFDFVVNLIAQSQVWSYLGATTVKLAPHGYGDCRMIKRLMDLGAGNPRDATLAALATAAGLDAQVLTNVFNAIAGDGYTIFLVQF
jgi:hypothetical protein